MIRLKAHYKQSSTNDGLVLNPSQHTAKIPYLLLHINLGALHNLYSIRLLEKLLTMVMMIWDAMHGKR